MSTARTMKNVGFTVPPSMAEEIDQMAKKEHRTKSEFFRRMFTLYRTYREQLEQAEEEHFERMIDEAIAEGLREKEHHTMPDEEYLREFRELAQYGAEQAKKLGIDVENDEVVNRMVHNVRARARERERERA
jgi:FKBP-type peptidyl-prolyl cis-trans isomerase (trigger factor)